MSLKDDYDSESEGVCEWIHDKNNSDITAYSPINLKCSIYQLYGKMERN